MIRTCQKCKEDYSESHFCRCTRRLVLFMTIGCGSALLLTGWIIGGMP